MPKTIRNIEEVRKPRSMKLSDDMWYSFAKLKPRDKSWELFIKELLEIIKYFKEL